MDRGDTDGGVLWRDRRDRQSRHTALRYPIPGSGQWAKFLHEQGTDIEGVELAPFDHAVTTAYSWHVEMLDLIAGRGSAADDVAIRLTLTFQLPEEYPPNIMKWNGQVKGNSRAV